jgi:alkanesulfonate monooxygenase SsuD/methylene tetrahydromethanopterin reductase-like flavin-dependent oxidoreductase (luciferase family)
MISRGERLEYDGKFYQLPLRTANSKALQSAIPATYVPIYIASLGPKALELTGELADGWMGTTFIPEFASTFLDKIALGASKAGKTIHDIDIQVSCFLCITDDPEPTIERRRASIAFQIGGMGAKDANFYKSSFDRMGFGGLTGEIQALWLLGERDEARRKVPVDFINMVDVIGNRAEVIKRLGIYRDAGVNTLNLMASEAIVGQDYMLLDELIDVIRACE